MKSTVRLAPGKPEIMLYWTDPAYSSREGQPRHQRKRNHRSWLRHDIADLEGREEDSIENNRRDSALSR